MTFRESYWFIIIILSLCDFLNVVEVEVEVELGAPLTKVSPTPVHHGLDFVGWVLIFLFLFFKLKLGSYNNSILFMLLIVYIKKI